MEIAHDNAEIICLQEVDHYDEIYKPRLEALGYQTQVVYRRGIDAELIAWKQSVFKFVTKQEIHYEDLVEKYGKGFKRGNVGLICMLKHIESGKEIIVANTHLHWNPKYDYVKFGQSFWL